MTAKSLGQIAYEARWRLAPSRSTSHLWHTERLDTQRRYEEAAQAVAEEVERRARVAAEEWIGAE